MPGPSTDIDYGKGPRNDQIELTVFGPGFGEAVAMHLGLGRWLLVDSCMPDGTDVPASADYLSSIGVPSEAVKGIVASHWHDDHVKGMSALTRQYKNAELFISGVFRDKESSAFLAAFSGLENPGLVRGTKEMFETLSNRATWVLTQNRSEVFHDKNSQLPVQVVAYSPTQNAVSRFLAHVFEFIPKENEYPPANEAPEVPPNIGSIVLHADFGWTSVLLGADLERHKDAGWDVVVTDQWCQSRSPSTIFKVSHHGSKSGDHPDIWQNLLASSPTAILSPFNLGRHSLPTAADRARILAQTSAAYITSTASRRPQMPADQLKRVEDMASGVHPLNNGFGAVRARCVVGSSSWEVETFGSAGTLKSMGTAA